MRAHLGLTNAAIIIGAAVFVVLVILPVRASVRLRAIDERLSNIADSLPASIDPLATPPVFVQTDADNGVILTRSANMGTARLPLAQRGFSTVLVEGHRMRIYRVAGNNDVLELAAPLEDDLPRGPLVPGVAVAAMVGVLTAMCVGWLLARIALRPIERLSAVVAEISSTSDLSLRVPVDDLSGVHPDAVQRLAVGFNAMLGRLEMATAQLDSALQAQRQFVAEASHQLRTPLTSLEGNVQLLSRMCAEDCPAPAVGLHQEILADLDQETDRMARLVNNLLALARADAQQHLVLQPLALEPLMRAAFRTARALSETVTVRLEEVPVDIDINADRDRFLELLTILLDNAVRYSPPEGEVVLRALADDAEVRVEVADNGPGIDPDERERIFERFYRARATSSVEGAGLGLAVARWIAAEHHARLTVIDNVPSGSVFQVWMERL